MIRSRLVLLVRFAIIAINLGHLAIHGTALDHGALDATIESCDAYLMGVVAWLNATGG